MMPCQMHTVKLLFQIFCQDDLTYSSSLCLCYRSSTLQKYAVMILSESAFNARYVNFLTL